MFKKWNTCLVALGVSLTTIASASAATVIDLKHQPTSFLSHATLSQSAFKQIHSEKDFNQTTHVRLQQTFQGYSVWGAEAVVHIPKGKTLTSTQSSMNGMIYDGLNKDLNNAPSYVFSDAQTKKAVQFAMDSYSKSGKIKGTPENSKAKLLVYVDKQNKAHWAFLTEFLVKPSQGRPAKPTYILDAQTMEIYRSWDNIQTMDHVEGGGNGGNLKTGMMTYDGGNGHLPKLDIERDASTKKCFLQNDDVTVTNAGKKDEVINFKCSSPDASHNSVYWDGMNDWANFGFSPGNDALYAGKVIKSMYQEWYQVPVLVQDGKPMMLTMRVHDHSLMGMENAYWDGKAMTFGDGLFMFYPLVSLGVGAHEISHGFTEQHSNLVYEGQSGGLNESFSDMAAQAAEFYSTGSNTWQLGSDITKAQNQALRYMDDPTKDCQGRAPGDSCSIGHMNDYNDQLDVHFSSGIFNKAYYLIGSSTDWNAKKAFDVMVQANMHYWTSNTSFSEAACGVIKATQDYKYDINAVKKAFDGVGIDTQGC